MVMAKIVNTALKAWTFEAKATGAKAIGPEAKTIKIASMPRPGLEDYITDIICTVYYDIDRGTHRESDCCVWLVLELIY